MMITAKPATRNILDNVLMAAIGVTLVVFGFRQSVAALITLPGNATLLALQSLQPVPADQLDRFIAEERQALSLQETAERWSNLSTALALLPAKDGDRRASLEEARDAARHSLALAPGNPYAWTRLTLLEQSLGRSPRDLIPLWRMAQMTGPNETRLQAPRIKLASGLWPEMTAEDRAAVFADIRALWKADKPALRDLASDDFTVNLVRAALVIDPKSFADFEKFRVANPRK